MASAISKPKQRRRVFWRVVFVLSSIVAVCALGFVGYILFGYWAGQDKYDKLEENMTVYDDGGVYTLGSFHVDWDALRAINPDVVGWVFLPDSPINYPIVWREGDDEYYLSHNFDGTVPSSGSPEYGCPMLSSANSPKWTDQANFVAGHHMFNGMVFGFLDNLTNDEGFNANRTFYVLTPEGNFKTTAIATDKIPGSRTDVITPNFESRSEFESYLGERIGASLVNPDPPAAPVKDINQVIAFYTCNEPDNSYRIIVYCAVDEFLPAGSDEAKGDSLVSEQDVEDANTAAQGRI